MNTMNFKCKNICRVLAGIIAPLGNALAYWATNIKICF